MGLPHEYGRSGYCSRKIQQGFRKPRVRWIGALKLWSCVSLSIPNRQGIGKTAREAYFEWMRIV